MSEWSGTLYGLGLCGRSLPETAKGVSGTVDGHGAERLKATTTSGELKQRSTGSWPSQEECIRMPLASGVTISASPADSESLPESATGNEGQEHSTSLVPAPLIFDRHGDDRFADNILRACRNLPQNGDEEEERDAAEEGALIEPSGYPDPASDPRFA